MQASYFETGRYHAPSNLPRQWPMPAGAYDREAGLRAFHGMVERSRYAEELGFDWVSVSEHHYSPHILTPSVAVIGGALSQVVKRARIALLGPWCRSTTQCALPKRSPCLTCSVMDA